jgi:hypothetical protein
VQLELQAQMALMELTVLLQQSQSAQSRQESQDLLLL